ncbi:MAG: efflux RND transporter permease subunit, partial [Duncaniella sp.]|nr:efflux RND transporter permease subunit [Duncaniella sp.]
MYIGLYDHGMDYCFRHKWLFITATLLTVPLCVFLFSIMPQERMPRIDSNETVVRIDWNENISLDENYSRVSALDDSAATLSSAYVGTQDYILSSDMALSVSEAEVYLLTHSPSDILQLQNRITDRITKDYPKATVTFHSTDNIFEKIFSSDEADIEARIHTLTNGGDRIERLMTLHTQLSSASGKNLSPIPMREQINLSVDRELLAVYNVDYSEVQRALRTAFKGNSVSTLRSYQEYTPIEITGREQTIGEVLNTTFVKSRADKNGKRTEIPLRSLISVSHSRDLKTITAGTSGEYVPVEFDAPGHEDEIMETVRKTITDDGAHDVEFTGSFFSNIRMIRELTVILLVSVMLMYFILCAQFESFLQPLIVLLEIPVDTFFALLTQLVFGQTLNHMSAIGIIVT